MLPDSRHSSSAEEDVQNNGSDDGEKDHHPDREIQREVPPPKSEIPRQPVESEPPEKKEYPPDDEKRDRPPDEKFSDAFESHAWILTRILHEPGRFAPGSETSASETDGGRESGSPSGFPPLPIFLYPHLLRSLDDEPELVRLPSA